jgi:hypothetical protein
MQNDEEHDLTQRIAHAMSARPQAPAPDGMLARVTSGARRRMIARRHRAIATGAAGVVAAAAIVLFFVAGGTSLGVRAELTHARAGASSPAAPTTNAPDPAPDDPALYATLWEISSDPRGPGFVRWEEFEAPVASSGMLEVMSQGGGW